MDKAYYPTIWENLPAETSPLDEINLNAISRGLDTVDNRVIDLDERVKNAVNSVTFDINAGLLRVIKDDGTDFDYNLTSKVMNVLDDYQQQNRVSFADIAVNFQDVRTLLDEMDIKIGMTAETANAGLRDVQTIIEENDGYYKREMSGIRDSIASVSDDVGAIDRIVTTFSSSITQTTQAIQLQVESVSQSVDSLGNAVDGNMSILRSQINQQAGQIDLKVSKLEVIDDLQQEFGSGISITPNRITFASTGAMVVNTTNFKLDEAGNAEFKGHVAMDSGSVGGVPILASPGDGDTTLSVQHSHHAWKLRSAAMDKNDTRYYTYMTANKNLISVNAEDGRHSDANDVTDLCSVGSYKYPWGKGYFNFLRVQHHNVIPEGLTVVLNASDWNLDSNGYYKQILNVNGMSGDLYLYIATNDITNLNLVYKHRVEVDTVQTNKVIFLADTQPEDNIEIVLLVEDFIYSGIDTPELNAEYDDETGILKCMWASPRDSSKFITWLKDELIIEKFNNTTGEWEQVLVVPGVGEEPFEPDQYVDTPLIIGDGLSA